MSYKCYDNVKDCSVLSIQRNQQSYYKTAGLTTGENYRIGLRYETTETGNSKTG